MNNKELEIIDFLSMVFTGEETDLEKIIGDFLSEGFAKFSIDYGDSKADFHLSENNDYYYLLEVWGDIFNPMERTYIYNNGKIKIV